MAIRGSKVKGNYKFSPGKSNVPDAMIPKIASRSKGGCAMCGRQIEYDPTLPTNISQGEMVAGVHFRCWSEDRPQ